MAHILHHLRMQGEALEEVEVNNVDREDNKENVRNEEIMVNEGIEEIVVEKTELEVDK